jgi:hypothetical protein
MVRNEYFKNYIDYYNLFFNLFSLFTVFRKDVT